MNNKISLNKPPATITNYYLAEDLYPFILGKRVSEISVVKFSNENENIIYEGGEGRTDLRVGKGGECCVVPGRFPRQNACPQLAAF